MNIKKILKNNQYRITKERVDIFKFLETKHIFTYNDILENFKNIWRASVFRTLNLFLDLGIIRKIDVWENAITYEIDDESNHHEHMKCEKCNRIMSFHSEWICQKIIEEARKIWFRVKSHNVWIMWVCKDCR